MNSMNDLIAMQRLQQSWNNFAQMGQLQQAQQLTGWGLQQQAGTGWQQQQAEQQSGGCSLDIEERYFIANRLVQIQPEMSFHEACELAEKIIKERNEHG